jgi:hypothetical protein
MEKIRNPKLEIRNKFKIQMGNAQNRAPVAVSSFWIFGSVSDFEFRISDLGATSRYLRTQVNPFP